MPKPYLRRFALSASSSLRVVAGLGLIGRDVPRKRSWGVILCGYALSFCHKVFVSASNRVVGEFVLRSLPSEIFSRPFAASEASAPAVTPRYHAAVPVHIPPKAPATLSCRRGGRPVPIFPGHLSFASGRVAFVVSDRPVRGRSPPSAGPRDHVRFLFPWREVFRGAASTLGGLAAAMAFRCPSRRPTRASGGDRSYAAVNMRCRVVGKVAIVGANEVATGHQPGRSTVAPER